MLNLIYTMYLPNFFKVFLLTAFQIIFLSNLIHAQSNCENDVIVQTVNGKLRGVIENNIYVWKGVRYAQPPIGNFRFKSPQSLNNWEGVIDADKFGAVCPQTRNIDSTVKTSEDCLFLNIWSPGISNCNRPVMVYIHGGAFYSVSGSLPIYNGSNLANKGDVVIVTINYRFGAFGFLYVDETHPDAKHFDNNIAIKDQVAALKWVKENISAFGGNPNNITIFGQSAGATSVLALMSTPNAKDLFHKAIAQSPAFNQSWKKAEAMEVTKNYLATLGVSYNQLLNLKTVPTDSILKYSDLLMHKPTYSVAGIGTWAPTIDYDFLYPYLTDSICSISNHCVPLLIGTMKNEMNLFLKVPLGTFDAKPKDVDKVFNCFNEDSYSKDVVLNSYRNYPKKKSVLSICTDGVFTMPCISVAENHSKLSQTYMYRFDWNSLALNLAGFKACHALDIFFVFNNFDTKSGKKVSTLANKKKMHEISDKIQSSWINFAKTGNPNDCGIDIWKKYDSEQRATMVFGRKTKLRYDPNQHKRESWSCVISK